MQILSYFCFYSSLKINETFLFNTLNNTFINASDIRDILVVFPASHLVRIIYLEICKYLEK